MADTEGAAPGVADCATGDDSITGNPRPNRFEGGAGNDALAGGLGDDIYVYSGEQLGVDTIVESADGGTDTFDFSRFLGGVNLGLNSDTAQAFAGTGTSVVLQIPEFFENATYRQIHPGVPLPTDEKFDAVLSSGTLEHVADLHRSMQELIGVLRPGGMVFIFRFPAQLSLSEYVARRSGRWSHAVRLRRRELEVLLQTHGVRIIESGYETFLPVALAGRSAKAQRLRQRLSVVAEASDRALTAMPVVRAFSTSMYCIGAQNAEYDSTTVERNLAPTDNRSKTATNAS